MQYCYRCGSDEHLKADCPFPSRASIPPSARPEAALDTSTPSQPPVPARIEPSPPTTEYLTAREALGIPSSGEDGPKLMAVKCPWCGSEPWRWCRNTAIGRVKLEPHEARYIAAGLVPDRNPPLADIARRQVDEARAGRLEADGQGVIAASPAPPG